MQNEDDANVLPEIDVVMGTNAVAAAWEVLTQHLLLLPFLESPGNQQGMLNQ